MRHPRTTEALATNDAGPRTPTYRAQQKELQYRSGVQQRGTRSAWA